MTPNRKPLYAKIAIARKQLTGMNNDATYRDFIENLFGVRSSASLNFHQLNALVQKFALMGAEFTSKGTNKRVTPHARPDWIEITDSMPHAAVKRQILAIWKKLGYSMSSLDTRVKRAFNVDLFVWLHDFDKLSTLLSDLQRREKSHDKKKTATA